MKRYGSGYGRGESEDFQGLMGRGVPGSWTHFGPGHGRGGGIDPEEAWRTNRDEYNDAGSYRGRSPGGMMREGRGMPGRGGWRREGGGMRGGGYGADFSGTSRSGRYGGDFRGAPGRGPRGGLGAAYGRRDYGGRTGGRNRGGYDRYF